MKVRWDKDLKGRYVAICFHDRLESPFEALKRSFTRLYGLVTLRLSGLKLIEKGDGYIVVRVWNRYMANLRASVALLEDKGEPVQAHIVLVSGTIKALRKKLSRAIEP